MLHDWAFSDDPSNRELMAAAVEELGAVIAGRVTYDHSLQWWGRTDRPDPPGGPCLSSPTRRRRRAPRSAYRVRHRRHRGDAEARQGGRGQRRCHGDGRASLGQQFIQAGLIDEISIRLVPVLFGGGTRMFDNLKIDRAWLEASEVVRTPAATYLRFPRSQAGSRPPLSPVRSRADRVHVGRRPSGRHCQAGAPVSERRLTTGRSPRFRRCRIWRGSSSWTTSTEM